MKIGHLLILLIFSVALNLWCSREQAQIDGELLVLENVTLIDGTGAPPRQNTAIVIQGDRIVEIINKRKNGYSDRATVVNFAGRYVLPGFIDMHIHLAPDIEIQQKTLKTLLAFGITTIRNAGAMRGAGVKLREKIVSGEVIGPRMITAGPFILFQSDPYGAGVAVKTESEIRKEVRVQKKSGVDIIKLQRGLPPNLVGAAIEEAHARGLKVIGHLKKTRWMEAARAGIDGIAHSGFNGLSWQVLPPDKQKELLELKSQGSTDLFKNYREALEHCAPYIDDLVSVLVENRVEVNPTLVSTEAAWWGDDLSHLEKLEPQYAPEANLSTWWWTDNWREGHPYFSKWSSVELAELKAAFPKVLEIVRTFHQRGVLITAGTDVGNPWMTPGVSFHRELELLAKAGIPALEVLGIATRNGAEALDLLVEIGTVEEGKIADLVILTANPLDDIRNTREIEAVIKAGRWFEPKSLIGKAVARKQTGSTVSVPSANEKYD